MMSKKEIYPIYDKLKDYDTFIYTSWVTDVDSWEDSYTYNLDISLSPLMSIAACCHDKKIVFVSSAFVFDGKKEDSYTEEDKPRPINKYGESKLGAETVLASLNPLIIRIDDTFGLDKLYQYDKAPWDRNSTPIYVEDLCNAIKFLLDKKQYGVFNVAGDDVLSRYGFCKMTNPKVKDCKLESLKLAALRPKNSCLNNNKIKKLGFKFTPVKEAITRCVK